MILSDKEIRELCTPPKFVITTVVPGIGPNPSVFYQPYPVDSFSYMTEEEIKAKINYMTDIGLKSYRPLTQEEIDNFKPMISPYSDVSVKYTEDGKKIPSWGSSSYGYDIRIGRNFKLFHKPLNADENHVIDICDFASSEEQIITNFEDVDSIVIPPHGFALGHSLEHINVPELITVICMGKSTIARSGLHMCITPLENKWSGYITIELENMTDYPIRLHSGIGISQLLFLKGTQNCEVSYADRNGKYQNQLAAPITPKL